MYNKNFQIFLYKIFNDALFLLLIVFAFLLIPESILPGIISEKLSFLKLASSIVVIVSVIAYLGKKNELSFENPLNKKSWWLILLILITFLIATVSSMLKFELFQTFVIIASSLFILIYFFKAIFEEN